MQFTRVNNKSGCAGPLVVTRISRTQIVSIKILDFVARHVSGPCASPVFIRPWAFSVPRVLAIRSIPSPFFPPILGLMVACFFPFCMGLLAWLPEFASNRSGLHLGTGANSVKLVDVPCTHPSKTVAIYYKGDSATF